VLRGLSLIAVATAVATAIAASATAGPAWAALAPSAAPVLVSPVSVAPVVIAWTPGDVSGAADGEPGRHRGHGHGHRAADASAVVQWVLRSPGPCDAPLGSAAIAATFADTTTTTFSDAVGPGTYCYAIAAQDAAGVGVSPGLTVVVATPVPVPVAVPVADPDPIAVPVAIPLVVAPPVVEGFAPPAPTGLVVSVSRPRAAASALTVSVRWANPAIVDLARVELVANARRAPRSAQDGAVVYSGLGTSATLRMRPGERRYLALFAFDAAGNVSLPASVVVAPPALSPLRPLSGSVVHAPPVLTWTPRAGAAYYNVQIFRNGKRVLVAWPSRPSYRPPVRNLPAGTYVWFVWPALGGRSDTPRFGALMGRATFTYAR
jgi:hypothetical protein